MNRYEISEDGTEVLDTRTGRVWRKNLGSKQTFYALAELIDDAGWRVPTIGELLTLIDYTTYGPATEFPFESADTRLWSCTAFAGSPNYGWAIGCYGGDTFQLRKDSVLSVLYVRGRE